MGIISGGVCACDVKSCDPRKKMQMKALMFLVHVEELQHEQEDEILERYPSPRTV